MRRGWVRVGVGGRARLSADLCCVEWLGSEEGWRSGGLLQLQQSKLRASSCAAGGFEQPAHARRAAPAARPSYHAPHRIVALSPLPLGPPPNQPTPLTPPQGTKVNSKGKEVPYGVRLYSIASSRYGDEFDGLTTTLCVRRAVFVDPETGAWGQGGGLFCFGGGGGFARGGG